MNDHATFLQPQQIVCELQQVERQNTIEPRPASVDREKFLSLFHLEKADITQKELAQLKDLLYLYKDVFSISEFDLGRTSTVKHQIRLKDNIPFKQRHRRIPPAMYNEVKRHLEELQIAGIIRQSMSPWSSCIVLVRKKDGSLRICVDFRELNKKTVGDSY